MRLACFCERNDRSSLHLEVDGGFVSVESLAQALDAPALRAIGDAGELLRRGPSAVEQLAAADVTAARVIDPDALGRAAPPLKPGKIVCVGLNYAEHVERSRLERPDRLVLFAKFPSCIIGPADPVILPTGVTSCVDYEGELGVVIGRRASRVRAVDAMDYVGGYTIVNDISARDLQGAEPQWLRAKSLDTFAPVGPYVVDPRSAGPIEQMRIQTFLNGERRQDASCGSMLVAVPQLIEYISEAITLEPGDLIATGTPSGVLAEAETPVFLAPGDVVEVEISGLGRLSTPIIGR